MKASSIRKKIQKEKLKCIKNSFGLSDFSFTLRSFLNRHRKAFCKDIGGAKEQEEFEFLINLIIYFIFILIPLFGLCLL